MARKVWIGVLVVAVLLSSASLQIFPVMTSAQAQSSSSCPANETLHFTWFGGIPTTFNNLVQYNSGVFPLIMAAISAGSPSPYPDGTLANYTTITNAITHNANYTQWTFSIRPGLKWYDGTPVTSADYLAEFSTNFALNPAYDPIGLHTEITSVNAINSSTVQFTLNQTDSHFAERISQAFLGVPLYPTTFTSKNVTYNGFGMQWGDGPFYISNYTAGQSSLIMLRNPYYQPQPKVCEIVWNFVESLASTATYVAGGATDLAPVAYGNIPALLKNPNIHIITEPQEWLLAMQYNVSVYPYNMTQFRQALAYGINQSQLAQQAYNGYAVPAYGAEGTIPPDSIWYNHNQIQYSFDQQKALQLLSSIGITKGSDGFLHYPNGTAISLTIWTDTDNPADPTAATFVSQDLRQIGFQVSLQTVSVSTMIGDLFSNGGNIQHEIWMRTDQGMVDTPYYMAQPSAYTWSIPGPTPNPYVAPASANAEYQSNLSAIIATGNPQQEAQYSNNIQNIFAQSLPTLPLVYAAAPLAYNAQRFTGWPGPTGYMEGDGFWNYTSLENLTPVGTTTSQISSTSSIATSSSSQSSTTSSASVTSTGALSSTSSTTSSSGTSNNLIIAIGVVVVIVVVAFAALLARRRVSTR